MPDLDYDLVESPRARAVAGSLVDGAPGRNLWLTVIGWLAFLLAAVALLGAALGGGG